MYRTTDKIKALNTINDLDKERLAIYAGPKDASDERFLNIIFNIETINGYLEISELFIDIDTPNIDISIGMYTIIAGGFKSFVKDMHSIAKKENQDIQDLKNYYISTKILNNDYIFTLSLKK